MCYDGLMLGCRVHLKWSDGGAAASKASYICSFNPKSHPKLAYDATILQGALSHLARGMEEVSEAKVDGGRFTAASHPTTVRAKDRAEHVGKF